MKHYIYLITPLLTWVLTGFIKFIINSAKQKRLNFQLIGYGGLPSNHTAIMASVLMLTFLKEGVAHPVFGLALATTFIIMLDAGGLRRHMSRQARILNAIGDTLERRGLYIDNRKRLRERIGHSRLEITAGFFWGGLIALLMYGGFYR